MKSFTKIIVILLAALAVALALAQAEPAPKTIFPDSAPVRPAESLTNVVIPNTTIESAV